VTGSVPYYHDVLFTADIPLHINGALAAVRLVSVLAFVLATFFVAFVDDHFILLSA
jgi:hypothetical protein